MKIHRFIIQTLFLLGLWVGIGLQAQAQTDTVTYVYTDQQGTPLAEADASGNITATFDYAPYGSQALGSPPNGPGYTGHVNDPETALVYMQARYYDPVTGHFLSTDPVMPSGGDLNGFNRYAYANNNPIANTDPDGRCPMCIVGVVVGGAILAGGADALIQKGFNPGQPINKTEVAIAVAGGALTAGSSTLLTSAALKGTLTVAQAILRQAAVSSAVGAGESVANNVADHKPVSGQQALNAAGANIMGSFLSSGFSGLSNAFAGASENGALTTMSNSAVNSPAGIGISIANTTTSAGNAATASSLSQGAFSSMSHLGDPASDILEQKLDRNQAAQ